MTEYSIIHPETFNEFKKHLRYITHLHLVYEPIINDNDNGTTSAIKEHNLYVYTCIKRKIRDISTEYWLIYKLPNQVYVSVNNHSTISHYQTSRYPIHIYLSEYNGLDEFKTVINTFKEPTDNIHIHVDMKPYEARFNNEHTLWFTMFEIYNTRNNYYNSIYGDYRENYVCHATYTHLQTNPIYNICHVNTDDDSRALNDIEFIKENLIRNTLYI